MFRSLPLMILAAATLAAACQATSGAASNSPRPGSDREIRLFQGAPTCPVHVLGMLRSEGVPSIRTLAFRAGADAVMNVRTFDELAEDGRRTARVTEGEAIQFTDPACRR